MKILHVIPTVSARYGGPSAVVRFLAREQAARGNRVTICTTNLDYPRGRLDVPTNEAVEEDRVATWYHRLDWEPYCFSLSLAKWIHSNIGAYDVVHVHGLYRFPSAIACWYARRFGVAYILRPHGSLDPFLFKQSRYSVALKRVYEAIVEKGNLNAASALQFTSEDELARVKFLRLRAPAVVVPNGIQWADFDRLPKKGVFRRMIGLPPGETMVLFLGRLNFKKGLDLLVPAFRGVLDAYPAARLVIVGPDNDGYAAKVREWCRKESVWDHVTFVDHVSSQTARSAYVDANVFVLPSYSENFGLTVVEAMACSCPVVVSKEVNIWREVEVARAGIAVDLNIESITKAVVALLSARQSAEEMGRNGRQMVQQEYDWKMIVDKLEKVYEEVAVPRERRFSDRRNVRSDR